MRCVLTSALFALMMAAPAIADEPKCPLDVATCLAQFEKFHVRPWLGIRFEPDSTGRILVSGLEPKSPAERGGIHVGDEIRSIEGKPPREWFATKAGWGPAARGKITVLRDKRQVAVEVPFEAIPEDVFARIIGIHMIEGHLAYMHEAAPEKVSPH
jgi:predicted metalloprotease with PDZ domain